MNLKNTLAKTILLCFTLFTMACTAEVPIGEVGMFFEQGAVGNSDGLKTDRLLEPATHSRGQFESIKRVSCREERFVESPHVLTKSDMNVDIDIQITLSAKCDRESVANILQNVAPPRPQDAVVPSQLYTLYVKSVMLESIRNFLAEKSLEEVKNVRGQLRDHVNTELSKAIEERKLPVSIRQITVSNLKLPPEILEKNKEIELARQNAEKEAENQKTAEVRLKRELVEAQQDRLVQVEKEEKDRQIKLIKAQSEAEVLKTQAEAELEAEKLRAQGIEAVRKQLTPEYRKFVEAGYARDVQVEQSKALSNAKAVYYIDKDFLVAPNTNATPTLPLK